MVNLWHDTQIALKSGVSLVHLTAEPISVSTVAFEGFGMRFEQHVAQRPAVYDFQTCHAQMFGGSGSYQYTARESLQAIRAYAQSEAKIRP